MGVIDILFIGIGLSMDAFAVSICKGLKMKVVDLKQCLMIAWFFGIFQAIMPTIGYVLSSKFVEYINAYSHWVTFVLLTIIGANMIRESVGNEEEETDGKQVVGIKELFGLAIATSIDALAVGITFGTMGSQLHLGITTFIISIIGVFIGNIFGSKYKTKAEIVGGIILILIGVKVVLEHYL